VGIGRAVLVQAGLVVIGALALLCIDDGAAPIIAQALLVSQGVSSGRAQGYVAQPGASAWTVLLLSCFRSSARRGSS
jgi:hypothetical protein